MITEDFHQIFKRGDEKKLSGNEVQMVLWLAVQELSEENQKLKQLVCLDHPEADICKL